MFRLIILISLILLFQLAAFSKCNDHYKNENLISTNIKKLYEDSFSRKAKLVSYKYNEINTNFKLYQQNGNRELENLITHQISNITKSISKLKQSNRSILSVLSLYLKTIGIEANVEYIRGATNNKYINEDHMVLTLNSEKQGLIENKVFLNFISKFHNLTKTKLNEAPQITFDLYESARGNSRSAYMPGENRIKLDPKVLWEIIHDTNPSVDFYHEGRHALSFLSNVLKHHSKNSYDFMFTALHEGVTVMNGKASYRRFMHSEELLNFGRDLKTLYRSNGFKLKDNRVNMGWRFRAMKDISETNIKMSIKYNKLVDHYLKDPSGVQYKYIPENNVLLVRDSDYTYSLLIRDYVFENTSEGIKKFLIHMRAKSNNVLRKSREVNKLSKILIPS